MTFPDGADFASIGITLKLATVSTLLLLVIALPLAWWLARTRARWKVFVEAVVALPLILPPTVLGFYLLIALGTNGPLARLTGHSLAFSFTGLVFGSIIYSLPFVVQPLRDAFIAVGDEVMDAAATLGASPMDRFMTIAVPLARPGFLTAAVLGFAHTIGEFGVALMIGGSIPGQTRVVSIAIYEQVEAGRYGGAHVLAGGLIAFSFVVLVAVYTLNRNASAVRIG
ncbi:molybdate ABC transporter permease subunit [Candidatus Sumerlaeota bacterium]|nr:molybdate ABC transporter permease subunit [Candidatus Sumerlaeota bacterium]